MDQIQKIDEKYAELVKHRDDMKNKVAAHGATPSVGFIDSLGSAWSVIYHDNEFHIGDMSYSTASDLANVYMTSENRDSLVWRLYAMKLHGSSRESLERLLKKAENDIIKLGSRPISSVMFTDRNGQLQTVTYDKQGYVVNGSGGWVSAAQVAWAYMVSDKADDIVTRLLALKGVGASGAKRDRSKVRAAIDRCYTGECNVDEATENQ